MASNGMVTIGRDRIRLSPWRSSAVVANVVPFPHRDRVDESAARLVVEQLQQRGYRLAFTAAMHPSQAEPFINAGFLVHEELHLLSRSLRTDPVAADRSRTRRARRSDWPAVLELDGLAFDDFWIFDETGLADSLRATPRHRFHVTRQVPVVGYHVTGLAGGTGYLQRVAVHPDWHGQGWGRTLVSDALQWLQRNNAGRAMVNTQLTNAAAVALYQACGFAVEADRLLVLSWGDLALLANSGR